MQPSVEVSSRGIECLPLQFMDCHETVWRTTARAARGRSWKRLNLEKRRRHDGLRTCRFLHLWPDLANTESDFLRVTLASRSLRLVFGAEQRLNDGHGGIFTIVKLTGGRALKHIGHYTA
jgi:hypothetical protein